MKARMQYSSTEPVVPSGRRKLNNVLLFTRTFIELSAKARAVSPSTLSRNARGAMLEGCAGGASLGGEKLAIYLRD